MNTRSVFEALAFDITSGIIMATSASLPKRALASQAQLYMHHIGIKRV